jgi:hypothetical protein
MLVKLDCVAGAGECLGETLLALDQFESLLMLVSALSKSSF